MFSVVANLEFLDFKYLLENLRFKPEEGKVWLAEQRIMLMGLGAMAGFRKEILSTLGMERGKSFFMRLGYCIGLSDADLVCQLKPDASTEQLFLLGAQLHGLRGMAKVVPKKLEYERGKKAFYAEFEWIDSFEVEICRTTLGQLDEPACWVLLGYACAYTSRFTGLDVQFREVSCCGKGDNSCLIIGKLASEWSDHEEFSQHFREAPLIDELYKLQSRIADLEQTLGYSGESPDVLGEASPFANAVQMIDKGANSEVSMLLIGETGTGKEMLARRVHDMSPRKEGPFVAVNCAAIPAELIESELFGVEKGAFTGATQSRLGRFERAHGGTIFLDEVLELSPRAQAALLRVIQEGELERVGDQQTRQINVRIVAATNENLADAVKEGRFRADLFYRINAYTVLIPPLRERRNDIALLAEHFRQRFEKRYHKVTLGFTDRAASTLQAHDWPGNIRELENTIERSIILTDSNSHITEQTLFNHLWSNVSGPGDSIRTLNPESGRLEEVPVSSIKLGSLADTIIDDGVCLSALENVLISKAMDKAEGNIAAAARLLGLTRPALAYRLKRAGDSGD